MQSYLGDYPGARSNPQEKFIRSVNSVINQTDSNWELLIISDGCDITENLYNENFTSYENIIFKKVDKPEGSTMYTKGESKSFYRGIPRREGVRLATGDWICYLDSDDIFLENAIDMIRSSIMQMIKLREKNGGKELRYVFNECIIENKKMKEIELLIESHIENNSDLERETKRIVLGDPFEVKGLKDLWVSMKTVFLDKEIAVVPISTAQFIHKKNYPSWEWGDSTNDKESEDNAFIKPITIIGEEASRAGILNMPYYVRCHFKGLWDC